MFLEVINVLFSNLQFDADVVGCIRDPNTNEVTAIDTWNALATTRNNIRDDTQDIVLFNSSFVNSAISCTFSRLITGSDPAPQDRNLNNDYFIIYGYREGNNNDITRFPVHDVTPVSSPVMFNPVNGNNQPFNGVTIPVRYYNTVICVNFIHKTRKVSQIMAKMHLQFECNNIHYLEYDRVHCPGA